MRKYDLNKVGTEDLQALIDTAYQLSGVGMEGIASSDSNIRWGRNGKACQPLWCYTITKSKFGGESQ